MESFSVKNFRSLHHLQIDKLVRVNLLVGRGNSGKTTVLEGLWALRNIRDNNWALGIESERGMELGKGDFRHLFYRFDSSNTIHLAIKYNSIDSLVGEESFLSAAFSLRQSKSNDLPIRRASEITARRATGSILDVLVNLSDSSTPQSVKFSLHRLDDGSTFFVPSSKKSEDFLDSPIPLPRSYGTEFITTTIDRSLLSEKIEELKVSKQEEVMLRILRQVEPRIQRVELVTGGQIYLDLGESFANLLPLNLMGEGFQRLLDIIAAIAQMSGGVVLIDELDNGLHYSALRILWKGILQAAREYDVQIVATTHSAEALRHLTWVLDEEENASYRDDVAAYTLIRADDDTVRSYRYGAEQLEYALEHDIEVRN